MSTNAPHQLQRLVVFLCCCVLCVTAWAMMQGDDQAVEFTDDDAWVLIRHESGTSYLLRTKSIVGFAQPMPGDSKGRNGLMISNGHTLATSISVERFAAVIASNPENKIIKMDE